jgi:uncharacterized protein (DUF362 family)
MDLSGFHRKRVLLKPNAGRIVTTGKGVTTDAQVVAAAIDAFTDAGAGVAVGESPIVGVKTHEAFECSGIARIARQRKCPLVDFNAGSFRMVPAPDGRVVRAFKVAERIAEYDAVVSIPVMKMHMHTGVSLALKNMKGCLWRRSKIDLHMLPPVEGSEEKPLDIAIADMAGILTPQMAIIDGTVGMEGLGPSAGDPKPLGVVVAGFDAFAADAVACQLMGTRAEQVPHLRMGAGRGYGVIDMDRITVTPENWRQWISPFEKPPENLSIEYPDVTIHDAQSCSACQSTLLLLLKRYKNKIFEYFPPGTEVGFAIGKGLKDVPENTVFVGNCTARVSRNGTFIKGCPPVASEILRAISGKRQVDEEDGRAKKGEPAK